VSSPFAALQARHDRESADSGDRPVISILIADDHAILRRGLKEILADELEGAILDEAGNAQEALAQVQNRAWDLVILDITMPGRSGLDLLRDLQQLRPKLPVLVLSMHPENQYAKRVLRAGAAGYMNKETAPKELVKAVRKVLAGGRYVSTALAEKLAADLSADAARLPHERLSDREFEVLRMIASGKMASQIADELHLSVTTVSTYRARILEKMGMTNNAELMRYAIDNRLVD
jgi:two-component system, NarL family, invasion response regulator UvrY